MTERNPADIRTQADWDAAFAFSKSAGGCDTSLLSDHFARHRIAALQQQEPSAAIASMCRTVTKWLDGGCSSWGVPADEIRALVAALENKHD